MCPLDHPMVHTREVCILLGSQCLGFPFHHSMVVHPLNPMQFPHAEVFMGQLELFLMFLKREVEVSGLGVVVLVLQLGVIYLTNWAPSNQLGVLDLISTSLPLTVLTASHQWVVHYPSQDMSIMYVFPASLSFTLPTSTPPANIIFMISLSM